MQDKSCTKVHTDNICHPALICPAVNSINVGEIQTVPTLKHFIYNQGRLYFRYNLCCFVSDLGTLCFVQEDMEEQMLLVFQYFTILTAHFHLQP